MSERTRRGWQLAGIALAGVAVGAAVRGLLPPFVLDDPFWRSFWSGPPAAGVFALLGAGVAFAAAWIAARQSRRSARRQEWWDRTEWALTQLMAEESGKRDIGLAALEILVDEATTTEAAMIVAVTSRLLGPAPGEVVDTAAVGDGQ